MLWCKKFNFGQARKVMDLCVISNRHFWLALLIIRTRPLYQGVTWIPKNKSFTPFLFPSIRPWNPLLMTDIRFNDMPQTIVVESMVAWSCSNLDFETIYLVLSHSILRIIFFRNFEVFSICKIIFFLLNLIKHIIA